MKYAILLVGCLLWACSDTTAPNLVCTGAVEVDIHVTRFGADTVATCVVAPPDTVVDTVFTPPDTIPAPPPPGCHWSWYDWRWHCHRGGHDHD